MKLTTVIDWLKKKLSTIVLLAIGAAVGAILFGYFRSPERVEIPKPYPVRDSIAIKRAIANVERIREDTVASLWDKIFRLQKRVAPTGYYGTPPIDPYPPRELKLSSKDSTIIAGVATPAIDAPISVEADRSTVTITTRNEWLRQRGEDYIKVYQWPRVARDFAFALTETQNANRLDGINLYYNKRAFEFDGLGIAVNLSYPKRLYFDADARFIVWERVELTPRLSTRDGGEATFNTRLKF